MNLIDKYKSPMRYEQIKEGDRLIVSELIGWDNKSKRYQLSVGTIVRVENTEICTSQEILQCRVCPCRGFSIEVSDTNNDHAGGCSCWYRFTTLDERKVI